MATPPERQPGDLVEQLEQDVERARRVIAEIERRRREAEASGMRFAAIGPEQLRKKLQSTDSPFIASVGNNSPVRHGDTLPWHVEVHNPDPVHHWELLVFWFVGPSNMVPSVGEALATADARFPRLIAPATFPGLDVPPGTSRDARFSLPVPAGVERGGYLGNAFLFKWAGFDTGAYIDRSAIQFEVA